MCCKYVRKNLFSFFSQLQHEAVLFLPSLLSKITSHKFRETNTITCSTGFRFFTFFSDFSDQVVKMKVGTMVETNPQLTVKGVGFDRTLGALEITLRLRDHLAKLFNEQKKTKNNVLENPRAMAKLNKEAERVKKILSANSETFAQVLGTKQPNSFSFFLWSEACLKKFQVWLAVFGGTSLICGRILEMYG